MLETDAGRAQAQGAQAGARAGRIALFLAAVALLAAGVVLALGVAMRRDINHDEHQFIAGAALIAREGLLPYRDLAWFHVPALAYLYAALFRLTDSLLLAARLLNVGAAAAMVALLLGLSLVRLRGWAPWSRLLAGALVLLALVATPAFLHASGRAWNHDLAVLLLLGAFLAQLAGLEKGGRAAFLWSGLAGLLLGLAAATRLSYAPLLLLFLLAPLIWHVGARRFWLLALSLAAGALVGLLPALLAFARSPEAFVFGNLTYAGLNTAWYRQQAGAEVASLGRKLADAARFVLLQSGNALLLGVTLLALLRVRHWRAARDLQFWLLLWPFLLVGALAATPAQVQYVYAFFPVLALGLLLALAYEPRPRLMLAVLAAASVAAAAAVAPRLGEGVATVFDRDEWYPPKAHARGALLDQLAESGRAGVVFTLSPTIALEGGAAIDPRTATGPFAWRVAPLLTAEERARYAVLGAQDFEAAFAAQPPRALLTGLHDDLTATEADLVRWAGDSGYVPVPLPEAGTLWLAPIAGWGGAIALGGHTFPAQPLAAGDSFVATLYLQATAPITQNLNLLVRAVDASGGELFREEGWPYGSPTSTWQPGAVWPHGLEVTLPAEASSDVYRVEASFYDPQTLDTLGDPQPVAWLQVAGAPAAGLQGAAAQFADGISLVVAEQSQHVLPGSASAGLPVVWQTWARPHADYTAFAHLVDGSGALVAQADAPPLGGFWPTSRWPAGLSLDDPWTLPLPPDLPAGRYTLMAGLYDATTMQRLPLVGGGDAFAALTLCVDADANACD